VILLRFSGLAGLAGLILKIFLILLKSWLRQKNNKKNCTFANNTKCSEK